jgi:UDP-N-acetylglucosamine enolpyruvyl transferase
MAQSDLTIENQSFPSFRADLNNALSALNSMQSGTSRPASAVAGTMWLDTTNATNTSYKIF